MDIPQGIYLDLVIIIFFSRPQHVYLSLCNQNMKTIYKYFVDTSENTTFQRFMRFDYVYLMYIQICDMHKIGNFWNLTRSCLRDVTSQIYRFLGI